MSDAVIEAMARIIDPEAFAALVDDDANIGTLYVASQRARIARECARNAIAAAEAMGWRLVPVEATREMKIAWNVHQTQYNFSSATDALTALLAAAPSLTGETE